MFLQHGSHMSSRNLPLQWRNRSTCGIPGRPTGRTRWTAARAASQTKESFAKAKELFEAGNRMDALRLFEAAIQQDLSVEERQQALYGATVVHASFGDIELAQMTLREGLDYGLDFEAALADSNLIKWRSGPQVLAQLKKFARTVKSVREAVKPPAKGRGKEQLSLGDVLGDFKRPNANMDLSEMLRTDIKGMDATVTGIVKRVALLLLVALLLGTALFFLGLEFSGIQRN